MRFTPFVKGVLIRLRGRSKSKCAMVSLGQDFRKVEVSWQVNDPLVNSMADDFKMYSNYPPRLNDQGSPTQNGPVWMPNDSGNSPFWSRPTVYTGHAWKLGVNLGRQNAATQPWGVGKMDSALKDPGVVNHREWRFPDMARGGLKNSGWLGLVIEALRGRHCI